MEEFKEIIGAVLESIESFESTYIGCSESSEALEIIGHKLAFDKGWLEIENPHTITGAKNLEEIIGLKVVHSFYNEVEFKIMFENQASVSISLKDEDFKSPEAASFIPKRGSIVVFD